ncbi:hypothetical protein [Phenylobacterium montanum]|uniref:Uncharacterized protein n=1 Tax=Phenylobacterium montanum TaxID=2823693 RepID=A0A975G0L3_9CAUL|nr:hypothetical protein [Caulobacter sp. S6]QUD88720.1 hypothetical protein KCG34_02195 [Caulobacter sp. S6]
MRPRALAPLSPFMGLRRGARLAAWRRGERLLDGLARRASVLASAGFAKAAALDGAGCRWGRRRGVYPLVPRVRPGRPRGASLSGVTLSSHLRRRPNLLLLGGVIALRPRRSLFGLWSLWRRVDRRRARRRLGEALGGRGQDQHCGRKKPAA